MKNKLAAAMRHIKKHKIITASISISLVILVGWGVINILPHPLGDRLQYLGKKDFGCWMGFCDSQPGSTFYYATSMKPAEVTEYFQKSTVVEPPRLSRGKHYFGLQTPSGETVYIYHYSSDNFTQFKTDKPFIVEIPSFKYQAALDSL